MSARENIVMTDDLDMGAILNHYSLAETIRRAMEAGNDLAMICHRIPSVEEAHRTLESLPRSTVERATITGVMCATGVSVPVRPKYATMSSTRVCGNWALPTWYWGRPILSGCSR